MDDKERKDVVKLAKGILRSPVLKAMEGDDSPPREVAEAWLVCDLIEQHAKAAKEELRGILLRQAERDGETTDKGGQRLSLDGITVLREKRQAKVPDDNKLRALLTLNGIGVTEAYDEVKTLVQNPSKVKHLVETGKLVQEEVDALRKVDYALKVQPHENTILDECK